MWRTPDIFSYAGVEIYIYISRGTRALVETCADVQDESMNMRIAELGGGLFITFCVSFMVSIEMIR